MKLLVLLSLIALCTCVPTTFKKHVVVDIQGVNEHENIAGEQWNSKNNELLYNPLYNIVKPWKQQPSAEESINQWVNPDVSNNNGHYWKQWIMHPTENTQGVVFPWSHKLWIPTELNYLTPVQRVHLLLNYIQQYKYWDQWSNDVTDEGYLHKMLSQYLPEQYQDVQFTHEQLIPQLVKYFKQYPLKFQQVMQSVVQTSWIFEQILKLSVQEIYEHFEQGPWSREQIKEHIIEHFGQSSLSYQQIQQLVELLYHLQYQIISAMHQKTTQTQMYPWNYKHLEQTQMKPWNAVFYNLYNNMKLNKQEYEQAPWINQQWEHIGNKPWVHFFNLNKKWLPNISADNKLHQEYEQVPWINQQWEHIETNPSLHFSNLNKQWLPNIYTDNKLHQEYQQSPWNYHHWAQTEINPWTSFLSTYEYPQQWNEKWNQQWNVEGSQYVPYEHMNTWRQGIYERVPMV